MKILLVCAAGMSTSILVEKIQNIAQQKNIDVIVDAKPNNAIVKEKGKWDVCLLGPQVRYAKDEIKKILEIPTEIIDLHAYAFADADKILQQAINLIEEIK